MIAFVDTPALLALLDADEADHERALTLDGHFAEQGFEVLPPPA